MHNPIHTRINTHSDANCQHPPFVAEASVAVAVAVAELPVSTAEAGSAAGLPNASRSPMPCKNRWGETQNIRILGIKGENTVIKKNISFQYSGYCRLIVL